MDSISESRLAEVHPALAAKIKVLAQQLIAENIPIRVVQGLRTSAEQAALYAKGRDAEGNIIDSFQVVTKAPPGHSWHEWGLAIDIVPFDGQIPDWNANHPVWKRIIELGEALGLVSGSTWRSFPDYPHFQLPGIPIAPQDKDRELLTADGIPRVWDRYAS